MSADRSSAEPAPEKPLTGVELHALCFGDLKTMSPTLRVKELRDLYARMPEFRISLEQDEELRRDTTVFNSVDDRIRETIWPFDAFSIKIVKRKMTQLYFVHRDEAGEIVEMSYIMVDFTEAAAFLASCCPANGRDWEIQITADATMDRYLRTFETQNVHKTVIDQFCLSVQLARVLEHSAVSTIDESISRPQRRAMLRDGKAVPRSSHAIVVRPGTSLAEVRNDVAAGRNVKPGLPKRRHRVREFTRKRLGKTELVHAHVRGGRASSGTSYVLSKRLLEQRRIDREAHTQ